MARTTTTTVSSIRRRSAVKNAATKHKSGKCPNERLANLSPAVSETPSDFPQMAFPLLGLTYKMFLIYC